MNFLFFFHVLKLSYRRKVKTLMLMTCALWQQMQSARFERIDLNIEVKSGVVASNNNINSPPLIKLSTLPLFCVTITALFVRSVGKYLELRSLSASANYDRQVQSMTWFKPGKRLRCKQCNSFWYLLNCWQIVYICHVYFTILLYVMYCML